MWLSEFWNCFDNVMRSIHQTGSNTGVQVQNRYSGNRKSLDRVQARQINLRGWRGRSTLTDCHELRERRCTNRYRTIRFGELVPLSARPLPNPGVVELRGVLTHNTVPSRISEGRQTSLTATSFVWANQRSAHAKSVPPRPRSGDGGPEIDQSQNSDRDSARLSQIPQQPLLPRSSLNADCALETRAMRDAITVSAAANRLECHMHFRAGPPPGQDDAVQ